MIQPYFVKSKRKYSSLGHVAPYLVYKVTFGTFWSDDTCNELVIIFKTYIELWPVYPF